MNTTTVSSTSIPEPVAAAPAKSASSRCPYLYPNGKRCSLLGSPVHSGFCPRHSHANFATAIPVQVHNDAEDLSADLLPELSEFTSGTDIRQFLARLLILITRGRISPRRASVLAFVTSQLLHSHRGILAETKFADSQPRQIIIDMPEPDRSEPYPENPTYADLRT
jgi:hypothetical protein